MRRILPGLTLCLAATLASGCSREGSAPGPGFLDDALLAASRVEDALRDFVLAPSRRPGSRVLDLDFTQPQDETRVSFVNVSGPPRFGPNGLTVATAANFQIRIQPNVEAADVTHLVVLFRGNVPPDQPVTVFWLQTGFQEYVADASVMVRPEDVHGNLVLIRLDDNSRWRGTISQVRVDVGDQPSVVRLQSISGLHMDDFFASPGPEGLPPMLATLDLVRRPGLVVTPTAPLVERVELTGPRDLVFHAGRHPLAAARSGATGPELVVTARSGRQEQTLSEITLQTPGWTSVRVDLQSLRGEVELRIATAGSVSGGAYVVARPRLVDDEPQTDRTNLLLISIDTLRADHLNHAGYPRDTSPAIAELAASGTAFTHCIASAPTTLPSHGAMFTGLHAIRNYVPEEELPPLRETLAERLRDAGYATVAIAGGAYFDPVFGLDQGFQTYSHAKTGAGRLSFLYNDVERNTDLALDWLDAYAGEPFFMFFHTYEVHSPYEPRAPYCDEFHAGPGLDPKDVYVASSNNRELPLEPDDGPAWDQQTWVRTKSGGSRVGGYKRFGPDIARHLVSAYDSEIRFTDAYIQAILERLDALGVRDNTVVVLTSDHGEAFGEHGRLEHGHLYDPVIRVPLVIAHPSLVRAGQRVDVPVYGTDIVPTCLDLLGLPLPDDLDGVSLGPVLRGGPEPQRRPGVSYDRASGVAIHTEDDRKFIANVLASHVTAGKLELFDLQRDPQELQNQIASLDASEFDAFSDQVLERLALLPGTHLRIRAQASMRFEGELRLVDTAPALANHLRMFPLAEATVAFPDAETATIETAPWTDWLIHLGRLSGTAELRGSFSTPDGEFPVQVEMDLTELRSTPRSWTLAEGAAVLVGTSVHPAGALANSATTPDVPAGTLEQLKALGYID